MRHTHEEIMRALDLADRDGARAAAEACGVSPGTISRWRRVVGRPAPEHRRSYGRHSPEERAEMVREHRAAAWGDHRKIRAEWGVTASEMARYATRVPWVAGDRVHVSGLGTLRLSEDGRWDLVA